MDLDDVVLYLLDQEHRDLQNQLWKEQIKELWIRLKMKFSKNPKNSSTQD